MDRGDERGDEDIKEVVRDNGEDVVVGVEVWRLGVVGRVNEMMVLGGK